MDYKYINQLLERYWNCETSLEEEEILRTFFTQPDIPAELEVYRPLFVYGQQERKINALGEEFDERMLAMLDEPDSVKARTVTLTQRLMPLFRAAAVVAIILTLGNAAQVSFREVYPGEVADIQHRYDNVSVALKTDSAVIDTLQQSSLQMEPAEGTSILK